MITKLRLKNFRRYEDETFEFSKGVTFLVGPNNAGKTSIFYAIEYALFGGVAEFRTPGSLLRPKADAGGVEMEFIGVDSRKYRLQRMHARPPKSRTKTVGHFTLKEISSGEGDEVQERYLLSSDFQDREEHLALRLMEILGLSKRLFQMAIHTRQSEAARVLAGDDKLDIVLGITAVALASEELRSMALGLEKQGAMIEHAEESVRFQRDELQRLGQQRAAMDVEKQQFETRRSACNAASERLREVQESHRRLSENSDRLQDQIQRLAREQTLMQHAAHELEKFEDASRNSLPSEFVMGEALATVERLETERCAVQEEMETLRVRLREQDQWVGDLRGRIERRQRLQSGSDLCCETCGQPIDQERNAHEIATWQKELDSVDSVRKEVSQKLLKLDLRSDELKAQVRTVEGQTAELRQSAARLTELQQAVSTIAARVAELEPGVRMALQNVREAVGEIHENEEPAIVVPEDCDADTLCVFCPQLNSNIAKQNTSIAVREAKVMADLASLSELEQRVEQAAAQADNRRLQLEREIARLETNLAENRKKVAHAQTLRNSSKAFQELQQVLREQAAATLATSTHELHRELSQSDEIQSVTIDPKNYSVHVRSTDYDMDVPASAFQGGGHRVLLGLAFRMGLARLVGHCPFLLLDEPTDGLDQSNRHELIARLSSLRLSPQMLVITHDAGADTDAQVIRVERPVVARKRSTRKGKGASAGTES